MTRFGMNPARNKSISYTPSKVTAAMMTYIPNLEGYFSHRLDVLKLSMESLIHSLGGKNDILVLNNGSCKEVRDYLDLLLENGSINYLIHSRRNLGVIGGFKILFNAAPGEFVAYSDDDVFYYPDWLEAHLTILDTYPKTGMVSGAPVGYSSEHAVTAVDAFIKQSAGSVKIREQARVESWEESWAVSTGRPVSDHLSAIQETPHKLLVYRGVEAVQSAKHFQFITPKKVICKAFSPEWSGSLMDDLVSLDESVDQLGYLRLSTPNRYARHIGNTLSEDILLEAEKLGINVNAEVSDVQEHEHWLLRIPGSGRILWPIYRWLFKVLHKVK
ncbi:MAG: glycosyltransferase family 2 protein [Chloroflexi bacterium]|nr:glycosyltransferase family 2 protein [Chloroflexota bacterium]